MPLMAAPKNYFQHFFRIQLAMRSCPMRCMAGKLLAGMAHDCWTHLMNFVTVILVLGGVGGSIHAGEVAIVQAAEASPQERLAAHELRRYIYQRTGDLAKLRRGPGPDDTLTLGVDAALGAQEYRLVTADNGRRLDITGGSPLGVLYGAYRLAEHLGVRFYLDGDVIPDAKLVWAMPQLNERAKPQFELRGLNPWGSHPFGFDQWSADDYKAIIAQMVKLRMNFIGMHCYLTQPYDEPTVWAGPKEDVGNDGTVTSSYPSRYYNTLWKGIWGPIPPKKTGDYAFGAAQLFENDTWGPPSMQGLCPTPETAGDCILLHNRVGRQFAAVFGFARMLGMKTCLGTEAPLKKFMPAALKARLKAAGGDPTAAEGVGQIYEGIFERIKRTHPLDYYWIWTPEDWTWENNSAADMRDTVEDVHLALAALGKVNAPFKLATCGWVLGPVGDRAAFDKTIPKHMAMSAISRQLGHEPLDPAFASIEGRDKWAIPWLESDGNHGLSALQLFAGRTLYDGAQAQRYGCTGLMGLHWRTRDLGPNVAALARAGWEPANNDDFKPDSSASRALDVRQFYQDMALASFGPEAAVEIGRVFAGIDGKVPVSVGGGCPAGSLSPLMETWDDVKKPFAFVDTMEALRPQIKGAGNLERFDYWLNTFRYHRMLVKVRCTLGRLDKAFKQAAAETLPAARKQVAATAALPIYRELVREYGGLVLLCMESATTHGGIAAVINLMANEPFWIAAMDVPGKRLVSLLGEALPADALPPKHSGGTARIIMPTVRSVLASGEGLSLKVILLNAGDPPGDVTLCWRPLGEGEYARKAFHHAARTTFAAELTAGEINGRDIEYFVTAKTAEGKELLEPVTAPTINRTVTGLDP